MNDEQVGELLKSIARSQQQTAVNTAKMARSLEDLMCELVTLMNEYMPTDENDH